MKATNTIMLEALVKLRNTGQAPIEELGICHYLECELLYAGATGEDSEIVVKNLVETLKDWEYYSGYPAFPIATFYYSTPIEEYLKGYDLWDKSTAYGRLRWSAVDFLIAKLEENPNEVC